jgi:RND superfamily putative drug exporter
MNSQFPGHRGDPVDVVIGLPARSPQVAALRGRIARMFDVAEVSRAAPAGASNSIVYVIARQGPTTEATKQLVRAVRRLHPAYYLGVAGTTAGLLDLESSLQSHLPVVLAIVVGATLLILFLMTGSVILPLKAVLMNGLTLSAMLGILVWVFQDGHLSSLLGFTSEDALDATMPVFLAAIGFGLATDYGVFLLGRIKEAHDAGLPNNEAVARGLERTGRIVTAAAMLFAVAIGAFVTSQIIFIKELGLGAALSVLIDATMIRALLVPSLMALLGPANWWAPKPLRRLHARIGLREGDRDRVAAEPVASS